MILQSLQRRRELFALTTLAIVLITVLAATLRPRTYTAVTEIVAYATGPDGDPEKALTQAAAWLRSPQGVRNVAQTIDYDTAARLVSHDIRSEVSRRLSNITAPRTAAGLDPPPTMPVLVRALSTQLRIERVPETYAIEIAFTHNDPDVAAGVANRFATDVVRHFTDATTGFAIRVVSVADPDIAPNGPDALLILAIGSLAGILIGAATAAIVEDRFKGLTSGAEVQSRLNLYHLGSVPLLRSVLPTASSPVDAIVQKPYSGYAESFRAVLVAMQQASPKAAKVFAVTSALPGEGKSTTLVCLARSAALAGESVVVVDCDSRRRGASEAMAGDRRGQGLADVLLGRCSIDDALVRDIRSGAWILPCVQNGVDLPLSPDGGALGTLLRTLRGRFDHVLVDTAPILAMATTRSILPLVDGAIMVVRWRATPIDAVVTALTLDVRDRISWSGVVLTQVDVRKQARYGHDDASAYYQQSSKYYQN